MADDDTMTHDELVNYLYRQMYDAAKEATKGTTAKFTRNVQALNVMLAQNPASNIEWATALCFLLGASIVDQSNQLLAQFPDTPGMAAAAEVAIFRWLSITIQEFAIVAKQESHGAGATKQ